MPRAIPDPGEVPVHAVRWRRSVRIVSGRFPPVGLFDRVASSEELEAVFALEGFTTEHIREEIGELERVPPVERVYGHGMTPVMAAFTHPVPSRFGDGSHGVYYCSRDARTAIRETVHHREVFLGHGGFGPMDLEMREYLAPVRASLHDLRGRRADWPALYDPDDYSASQPFGAALRATGSRGLVYDSVRDPAGGPCAALLQPPAVGPCTQGRHLLYRWDGHRIAHVLEISEAER